VLTPYGSLFFASASVFENQLPVPEASSNGSVVVLRMRGKEDLGSTFINTIVRYHDSLRAIGSHLVLAGIGERVLSQLTNTEALHRLGADNVFAATPQVGESLQAALQRARVLQDAGSEDPIP
jgi:SulP family sulfate permease